MPPVSIDTKPIQDETVHKTVGSGILAINVDTIINLLIVSALLVVVALVLRRQLTSGRPGRLQAVFEMIIEFVNGLIKDTLGAKPIRIAPLAISLFVFLLFANWWGLLPFFGLKSQYLFKSPTNDVNVAFALAIMSIVLLHFYSIRFRGPGGYVKHYFSVVEPSWRNPVGALARILFAFLELIQEISRPITLSFRLYFNIFVGELMLVLIITLLSYASVITFGPVWVLFSLFVGGVQAFIFTMLTIAYIAMGTETSHSDDHGEAAGATSGH